MWNSMFFFSSCVVLSIFTKETIWMVLYWICLIFLFCLKAYRIDKWPKIKRCDRIDGRHVEHSAIAGFFSFCNLIVRSMRALNDDVSKLPIALNLRKFYSSFWDARRWLNYKLFSLHRLLHTCVLLFLTSAFFIHVNAFITHNYY